MTSKYWTSNHKSSVNKASLEPEDAIAKADITSCGESFEEDIVTNNMESRNNDANVQESPKNFTISSSLASTKRRPDSLKLSYDYGSSSDLVKSATSNAVDVNQSKSLSAVSSKSHHDGKKSTSYDLWVNENVEVRERNGSAATGEKKLDLPGRVSFR